MSFQFIDKWFHWKSDNSNQVCTRCGFRNFAKSPICQTCGMLKVYAVPQLEPGVVNLNDEISLIFDPKSND